MVDDTNMPVIMVNSEQFGDSKSPKSQNDGGIDGTAGEDIIRITSNIYVSFGRGRTLLKDSSVF